MKEGKIFVISAPSGTGKSTIINSIIDHEDLKLRFSVSATNRSPREGEVDGVNYYYLSTEEFQKKIAENAFIEFEEVYSGRYYGTLKSEVERILGNGYNLVLDIDVKGGLNVKRQYPDAVSIFIQPPSIECLRERLINRKTDSMDVINERVAKAEYELSFAKNYDNIVVNDVLETAIEEVEKIIKSAIQ